MSNVLNEQGTGYELIFPSISIEVKNGARHLIEHPKISKFTKFYGYWFKHKGMVHLVWIGGTGVLQSILSSLILAIFENVPCLCVQTNNRKVW